MCIRDRWANSVPGFGKRAIRTRPNADGAFQGNPQNALQNVTKHPRVRLRPVRGLTRYRSALEVPCEGFKLEAPAHRVFVQLRLVHEKG